MSEREAICLQLIDMATRLIEKRNQSPLIHEEKDKDYRIWQELSAEGPKTIIQYRADGLTPQLMQGYTYNIV